MESLAESAAAESGAAAAADTDVFLIADEPCAPQLDVDALFPEPEIRQMLQEIAVDLHEVNRFVTTMNKELAAERPSDAGSSTHFRQLAFRK